MNAPQPYMQPVYVAGPPTSGTAAASLVFGILGALVGWCLFAIPCLLAIIFGHVALRETRAGGRGGRGMAVAGLILGYVFLLPWAALAVAFTVGTAATPFTG